MLRTKALKHDAILADRYGVLLWLACVYRTNELKDAAGTSAALGVLPEHASVLDAAGSDEHVQKLRRRGPQHLL